MIPDELVRAVHLAAFLHAELRTAFDELSQGTMQTKSDLLSARIATVDGLYESMWDQLKIARDHFARLGWNTAAYDEAYAVLGVTGTKMAIIDAVNTYGMSVGLTGGRGLTIHTGGDVGVTLNVMGVNTALGVLNQMRSLLPEVDWSRPPPPREVRAPEPDLQVVDDGSYVESVRPAKRAGWIVGGAMATVLAGGALFLATASDDNNARHVDAPKPEAEHTAVTFDELRGMDTVRLTDNLVNGRLLDGDVEADARAELEQRYRTELATADLQQVFYRAEAADQLALDPSVMSACALRIVELGKALPDLVAAFPRRTPQRLREQLGALLATRLGDQVAAAATVDDVIDLAQLSLELGDHAATRAAIAARLAALVPGELKTLDVHTLELLENSRDTLGLPPALVDQIDAELSTRPM